MDQHLRHAIQAATDANPVKIVRAVVAHRSINVAYPRGSEIRIEMWAGVVKEEFYIVGIKLEGMDDMGWIWGQDSEEEFYNSGLYSWAFVMKKEET